MASVTSFGQFPGVKIDTQGGGITGVTIGREQKLVIFGEGDPSAGSASTNTPTQIQSRQQADAKFGANTPLANALKEALANGANIDYLYGVMPAENTTSESFAASASFTLTNVPIVEDASATSATDDVAVTAATVQFKFESPPTAPSSADTINLNPLTGEATADASSDYTVSYKYLDWSGALNSADTVVGEEEVGVFLCVSESESVITDLESKLTTLRAQYRMVLGLAGAQPNKTATDGDAEFDTSVYTDAFDNDALFLVGPVRLLDKTNTVLGGVGGRLAGNDLDDPIHNDTVSGYTDDLDQKLTKSEADNLRAEEVIPMLNDGDLRIGDNMSTSTATDWERDYWRRRIVDVVINMAKQVGDSIIGRINDDDTREAAQVEITSQIENLVEDRLLKPNTQDEQRWYVDVYEDSTNADQVNIELGITPYGIVKRVDQTITIST